jgi:hypothetical protein
MVYITWRLCLDRGKYQKRKRMLEQLNRFLTLQ